MKNLIVVVFSLIVFNCFGQIGIGTGVIANKMTTNSNLSPKISFAIHPHYNLSMNEFISIRMGIMYSKKGAISTIGFTDINGNPIGNFKQSYNYNYLELPLSLVVGEDFHGLIGFAPSYVVSAIYKYSPDLSSDFTASTKRFDFGLHIGLGQNINMSEKSSLNIEGILSYGLINNGWGNNLAFYLMSSFQIK